MSYSNLCIFFIYITMFTLHWRHDECDGVSNHQPHDCLLKCLFRGRSKKTSKLRVTGLCAGNSLATSEFPARKASNVENVSIWWRHHENFQNVREPILLKLLPVTLFWDTKSQIMFLSRYTLYNYPLSSNYFVLLYTCTTIFHRCILSSVWLCMSSVASFTNMD